MYKIRHNNKTITFYNEPDWIYEHQAYKAVGYDDSEKWYTAFWKDYYSNPNDYVIYPQK